MDTKSEDLHLRAIDRFIGNAAIKTGYGLGIGILFSLTVFRRRLFPVYLGAGTGLGMALSDLDKQLKSIKQ